MKVRGIDLRKNAIPDIPIGHVTRKSSAIEIGNYRQVPSLMENICGGTIRRQDKSAVANLNSIEEPGATLHDASFNADRLQEPHDSRLSFTQLHRRSKAN
jgi:hypothetical protein